MSLILNARKDFHTAVFGPILRVDKKGVPGNADSSSKSSIEIAQGIVKATGIDTKVVAGSRLPGQRAGAMFEDACCRYIEKTFLHLEHLRPGSWVVEKGSNIALYDQYSHLDELEEIAKSNSNLRAALGSDYVIKPDVVVFREPESDKTINSASAVVDNQCAKQTSLRLANNKSPILHASVSCKWTIRSDRAQNARSEGLNLVKNRKGRLPHVTVVTAEPTPNRIASIALGTGEIDCVYHFALDELVLTLSNQNREESIELINTMISGKRLKDISDLPLDLAI